MFFYVASIYICKSFLFDRRFFIASTTDIRIYKQIDNAKPKKKNATSSTSESNKKVYCTLLLAILNPFILRENIGKGDTSKKQDTQTNASNKYKPTTGIVQNENWLNAIPPINIAFAGVGKPLKLVV